MKRSAAPSPDGCAIFERDVYESLVRIIGDEKADLIVNLSIQHIEGLLVVVVDAAEPQADRGRSLHMMASVAGNIGLRELSDLAHDLDQRCRLGGQLTAEDSEALSAAAARGLAGLRSVIAGPAHAIA